MAQPLKRLIAEGNPADAERAVGALQRAGFAPEWQRVETEAAYLAQLHSGLDVVVSDFQLPGFTGLRALGLLQERGLEVPFILVAGTIGEETAVEAIKQGASDYLPKDRLARLGPAVRHALAESKLRRERRRAEEALRESETRFRELAENIDQVFWVADPDKTHKLYLSPAFEKIWGHTCQSGYDSPHLWLDAIRPEDRERVLQAVEAKQTRGTYAEEYRILRPDGEERWISDRAFPVRDATGAIQRWVGVATDTTAMPLLGGLALGRVLAQLRPNLRVLVMSGLAWHEPGGSPEDIADLAAHAFLQEPFTFEALLEAVDRLLHPIEPPAAPALQPAG